MTNETPLDLNTEINALFTQFGKVIQAANATQPQSLSLAASQHLMQQIKHITLHVENVNDHFTIRYANERAFYAEHATKFIEICNQALLHINMGIPFNPPFQIQPHMIHSVEFKTSCDFISDDEGGSTTHHYIRKMKIKWNESAVQNQLQHYLDSKFRIQEFLNILSEKLFQHMSEQYLFDTFDIEHILHITQEHDRFTLPIDSALAP